MILTPEETAAAEAGNIQLTEREGYHPVVTINKDEYAAVHRLMFHWTMLRGLYADQYCYEDRWCYATYELATQALAEWQQRGFAGEPEGWHRHPSTGRRRVDGDPATEYIAH